MNIAFDIHLINKPIYSKHEDWRKTAFEWRAYINGETFDYYTGSGQVDKMRKPKRPTLDDVLYSLVLDAEAENQSFEDWCDNFGYSSDSRKALETYLLCQTNAIKLRKAGINIEQERSRLQEKENQL